MAPLIRSLESAVAGIDESGARALRGVLRTALRAAPRDLRWVRTQRLKPRVFRFSFDAGARAWTLIAKRLEPLAAWRSEQIARRWLPAVGIAAVGPSLLAAGPVDGAGAWHVYEDLGQRSLEGRESDQLRVAAAVRSIALLHSRFASHPLLAECRPLGALDVSHYAGNLRDALRALGALADARSRLTRRQVALCDRLLRRLEGLLAQTSRRARALEEWGGPETLLHGDLWTSNVFVVGPPERVQVRLIDWDRTGVGPISYDLSAFLLRFPPAQRSGIVELYRRSLEIAGWRPPSARRLDVLMETAELGRCANRVIWPALAIADGAAWGFTALAEVEGWFETLEPILARSSSTRRRITGRSGAGS
jgi:hypothetical protein